MVRQIPSSNVAETALVNHQSYFTWLCEQSGISGPLARMFYETDFRWVEEMNDDENRAKEAKDLRELYAIYLITGDGGGVISDEQWREIDILKKSILGPACVFEVFVCLARNIDNLMTEGPESRVKEYFNLMMDNADFTFYDDSDWDAHPEEVEKFWQDHLDRILDRKYLPDGEGGLFPLDEPDFDVTQRSLWDQMNEWVNQLFNGFGDEY